MPILCLKGNIAIAGNSSVNVMACALRCTSSLGALAVGTLTASRADALTLVCGSGNNLENVTVEVTGVYAYLDGVGLACLKSEGSYLHVRNVPPLVFSSTGSDLTVGKSKCLTVNGDCGDISKNAAALILCKGDLKSYGCVLFCLNNEGLITAGANAAKALAACEALDSGLFKACLRNESVKADILSLYLIAVGCVGNSYVGSNNYGSVTLALICTTASPIQTLAAFGPGLDNLSSGDPYAIYQWGLRNDGQVQYLETVNKYRYSDPELAEEIDMANQLGAEAPIEGPDAYEIEIKSEFIACEKVKTNDGTTALMSIIKTTLKKGNRAETYYQKVYEFGGVNNKYTFAFSTTDEKRLNDLDDSLNSIVLNEASFRSTGENIAIYLFIALIVLLCVAGIVRFIRTPEKRRQGKLK